MTDGAGRTGSGRGPDVIVNAVTEEVLTVGSVTGNDWDTFGRVGSVHFDAQGNLHIFDPEARPITSWWSACSRDGPQARSRGCAARLVTGSSGTGIVSGPTMPLGRCRPSHRIEDRGLKGLQDEGPALGINVHQPLPHPDPWLAGIRLRGGRGGVRTAGGSLEHETFVLA